MRMTIYKPSGAAFGAAVCLLGLGMIWEISALPEGASYAAVGPKVFPFMVGGGMAVAGIAVILEALFSRPADEAAMEYDILPVFIILAGLIAASYVLNWLGWGLTSAVVFVAGAYAFGERRMLITAAIGLTLGLSTYLLFNYALKLSLPAGILGF